MPLPMGESESYLHLLDDMQNVKEPGSIFPILLSRTVGESCTQQRAWRIPGEFLLSHLNLLRILSP